MPTIPCARCDCSVRTAKYRLPRKPTFPSFLNENIVNSLGYSDPNHKLMPIQEDDVAAQYEKRRLPISSRAVGRRSKELI